MRNVSKRRKRKHVGVMTPRQNMQMEIHVAVRNTGVKLEENQYRC